MPAANASSVQTLHGFVSCVFDDKRRVCIPADWRKKIGDGEVMLVPSMNEGCIKLMPLAEYDRLRAFAETQPGPVRTAIHRKLGYDSQPVRPDAQGRFVLGDDHAKRLDLNGTVIISGASASLELWNPKAFAAMRVANDAAAEAALREYGL